MSKDMSKDMSKEMSREIPVEMPDELSDKKVTLTELMRVQQSGAPDQFIGKSVAYGRLGIYGGHFLGQALAAAFETVDLPKRAHSFHAYFLRAGNPEVPIVYQVSRLRESRGGDTRAVSAIQDGACVFHMTVSFKMEEAGDEHQMSMPVVKTPEAIVSARQARGEGIFPFPVVQAGRVQMEWVSPSFLKFDPKRKPALRLWMRVLDDNLSARENQVALAFLSDGTLMFNSLLPHGTPMQSHRLTSLDQAVWFHRDARATDWLLFDQRSTAAADGRGMNSGEIFAEDGRLIMSCAQESMLRRIT